MDVKLKSNKIKLNPTGNPIKGFDPVVTSGQSEVPLDLSSIQNTQQNRATTETKPPEPKPEPQAPPVPTYEDTIKKRHIILIIQRYIIEFSDCLPADLIGANFSSLSADELANLLTEIKFCVATRNTTTMSTRAMKQGVRVLETGLCTVGVKCQDLYNVCDDKDFDATLREFTLDNMNLFYTKPQYRLMYSLLMAIVNLHMINSKNEKDDINKAMKKKVDKKLLDIDSKFNNLIKTEVIDFSKEK
jgi:hypothetical protein